MCDSLFSAFLHWYGGCRLAGGELQFEEHKHNEDMGSIESFLDLDVGFANDAEYDEVCSHIFP